MKIQVPTTKLDAVDSVIGTAAGTVSQTAGEVNSAVPDCTIDSWVFVWAHSEEDFRAVHRREVFQAVIHRRFHHHSLRANVSSATDDPVHGMNGGVRWTIPMSIQHSQ